MPSLAQHNQDWDATMVKETCSGTISHETKNSALFLCDDASDLEGKCETRCRLCLLGKQTLSDGRQVLLALALGSLVLRAM